MSQITTHIQIGFHEIQGGDPTRVVHIIDELVRIPGEAGRNGLSFGVSGYDNDPRELCEIPEVRAFFQQLWDRAPGLLYWIRLEATWLIFLASMIYPPVRVGTGTTIAPGDLIAFLQEGFARLNAFCEAQGLSSDPTTYDIRDFMAKALAPRCARPT